jgi:hypothetical protein
MMDTYYRLRIWLKIVFMYTSNPFLLQIFIFGKSEDSNFF